MDDAIEIPRDQFAASMALLQANGLRPATFIDIGAAEGGFFLGRRELDIFPQARHFFIDAMQENEAIYRTLGAKFNITSDLGTNQTVLRWARFAGFPALSLVLLLMVQAKSSRGLRAALGESELESGGDIHVS